MNVYMNVEDIFHILLNLKKGMKKISVKEEKEVYSSEIWNTLLSGMT